MSDIYETPKANLENETDVAANFGSIEKGIAGEYKFTISEVLSEAWEKTAGAKGSFMLAFAIYFGISIGLSIVAQIFMAIIISSTGNNETAVIIFSIIQQLVFNLILLPIGMGMFILGLRRSANASLQPGSIMGYYSHALRLFGTMLLMYFIVMIGFILFVIPGIYLMVAYYMAMPLVVEKGLSPWQALEVSRKTISKRWFTMFFFMIVITLIAVVAMIPLGIGLIWAAPMMLIAYGIIYRNMFGIRSETLAE